MADNSHMLSYLCPALAEALLAQGAVKVLWQQAACLLQ